MDFYIRYVRLGVSLSVMSCVPASVAIANEIQPVVKLQSQKPALLLAKSFQESTNIENFLVSEKLDGVRAYWNGRQFISRGGKVINAPVWFTRNLPKQSLDGELWLARNQFDKLSGIVRKKNPVDSEWQEVKFVVFDLPLEPEVFQKRYQRIKSLVNTSRSLTISKQLEFHDRKEFDNYYSEVIAKGGEGVMLHRKNSLYQGKRSYDLQKLKPYEDAEAKVVGYVAGKGKYQGLMGALEVVSKEGAKFKIGSGFSLQERKNPPAINSVITFRYRGKTKRNIPRFATFLRRTLTEY